MANDNGHGLFKECIKKYLDNLAAKDSTFAPKYAAEGKSIDECCKYIISQVKKMKREGFADEEIYGMAVHYYDEADCKPDGDYQCTIVSSAKIELSEEEMKELRQKAQHDYYEQQMSKMREVNAKKVAKKKPQESLQPSLFDMFNQ